MSDNFTPKNDKDYLKDKLHQIINLKKQKRVGTRLKKKEKFDVIETIRNLQKDKKKGMIFADILNKYKQLYDNNRDLFRHASEHIWTEDDYEQLIEQLDLREKVRKGEMSFQDASSTASYLSAKRHQPELLKGNANI